MKKNLIELCLSPDLGGLELYMVRAAKALRGEFNVLSVLGEATKLTQYYEDGEHSFAQIKRYGSFSIRSAWKLAKIIDEHDTDILHLHWTKDIPVAVMAKLFSKKRPKLVQTRNMTMTRFKNDFYHRFLYKNIEMMLPVTYQVADQIYKFIPEDIRPRVEVLYMGSDKPEILSDALIVEYKKSLHIGESFMIGLVGRINPFKGQYLLVEAMEQLISEGLDIQAYIVGHAMEASYLETLKKDSSDKGLENKIHFLGFEKNPHRFMQACDVVLMTSKHETFGLVTIEAMQVGTAVIGANSGGVLEIIDDNETGLLFESQNSHSLAEQIKTLYHDPRLRNTLALNGQRKAEEMFSNEHQFHKLSTILRTL
jgi:glycosyltransferase involved in cell wall biosynthesis